MSSGSSMALAVTTGVAALVGGFAAWKINSEYNKLDDTKEKNIPEIVHLINVEDIAGLLNSEDSKIRQTTEKLLIKRASRHKNLLHILKKCLGDDMEQVVKAVTAVYLLARANEEIKGKLLNAGAFATLPKTIRNISDNFNYKYLMEKCQKDVTTDKILTRCIGSVFHLTLSDPCKVITWSKESMCIKEIFLNILGDNGHHISTDMKRWSTYIIHLLAQSDSKTMKTLLRKWGVIRKASWCLIKTLGDVVQTQICLQILVQYFNDLGVQGMIGICQEMATLGLLPHLVGFLRCDENESVVHLSSVIIHHFCCFDLEIKALSGIPGIVKILYTVLSTTDSRVQQTILRICNYLSVGSTKFQKLLLAHKPMIKKLSVCLVSGNSEVVEGSLMLIHDLAMPGKLSVQKLVTGNPEILKSLVSLSLSSKGEIVQLIAETLGFICSCECLHSLILKYGIVNSILHFAKSSDIAVQFWASALLLNLSMISDEVKETIIRSGGINILLEMAVSGDEVELPDIATNATKTLVILGFLDAVIDVSLASGIEASIIIDGTEHCPGKQGINLVSLDFINYKYSKGKVIQPSELQAFVSTHFESMKESDPVFVATQGDCIISTTDEEIPKDFQRFMTPGNELFLNSPAWALMLIPEDIRVRFGDDNIEFREKIKMEKFVSVVLKENFTDPLIDVLLSIPPSTTISKIEELELVEILARHSFQRKAIVSTAGFLEYLNELIWEVASLKSSSYIAEEKNSIVVTHCVAALKILHLCSLDALSLKQLLQRGLLQALVSLLIALIPSLISKGPRPSNEDNVLDDEQKPPWLLESTQEELSDDDDYDTFVDDIIEFTAVDPKHRSNPPLRRYDTEIITSNDDLFVNSGYDDAATYNEYSPRTVTYADEVEYIDDSPSNQRAPSRLRSDSIIVRSDSRNIENRRTQSMMEQRAGPSVETADSTIHRTFGKPHLTSVSEDHQQMRRISRSMSISLQQAKSENYPHVVTPSEVLKQLVKQTIMILYHVIKNGDIEIHRTILSVHILPVLGNILCCFTCTFRQRIGVAISSALLHLSTSMIGVQDKQLDRVTVQHVDTPRSVIISSDGLQISNENWFFESVKANQGVSKTLYSSEHPDGWYYEVIVLTDGILQIGWTNSECIFNPEKGIGVGDTVDSCGFDGARCKIWSGPSRDVLQENDYGIEWQSGDVISVLLSWDGSLSFWLNGKDLGPAPVKNFDLEKLWYPAISLSIDQHCTFIFKDTGFRHKKPVGYDSISTVHCMVANQDDIISMSEEKMMLPEEPVIVSDLANKYLASYFEVDLKHLSTVNQICIGYLHNTSDCEENPSESSSKQNLLPKVSSNFTKIIETVSCLVIDKDGGEQRINTIGCGLLMPCLDLIITKDAELVFRKSISEMVETNVDSIMRLIPYVSSLDGIVNMGQDDFVYEKANSLSSKKSCIDLICSLINKLDKP